MSKNLNLLTCGGVITSVVEHGVPVAASPVPMAALVQELWGTPVTHAALMEVGAESTVPPSWTQLLEAVRASDGPILITHDTDTISWAAAALAVTDVADSRPVVLTGANVRFGDLGSDAPTNLNAALTVCRQMENGVWVVFAGSDEGSAVVIEGGFARKTLPAGSCLTDVSGSPFATVAAGSLVVRRQPRTPSPRRNRSGRTFSAPVATFRLWPGLALPKDPSADRVVIELHRLDTAPRDVLGAISRWVEADRRVVAVPSWPADVPPMSSPECTSASDVVAAGAEARPELTFELAVCSEMLR